MNLKIEVLFFFFAGFVVLGPSTSGTRKAERCRGIQAEVKAWRIGEMTSDAHTPSPGGVQFCSNWIWRSGFCRPRRIIGALPIRKQGPEPSSWASQGDVRRLDCHNLQYLPFTITFHVTCEQINRWFIYRLPTSHMSFVWLINCLSCFFRGEVVQPFLIVSSHVLTLAVYQPSDFIVPSCGIGPSCGTKD